MTQCSRSSWHRCIATAVLSFIAANGAEAFGVRWSGELRNLRFSSLGDDDVERLGARYADDVAYALGLDSSEVLDMDGKPGRVSLSSGATSGSHLLDSPGQPPAEVETTARAWSSASSTTTTSTTTVSTSELSRLSPIRGIAYGALPCTQHGCSESGIVSEDMLQDAYSKQWGADGRDDLGIMARMGANTVRLYHSLGLNVKSTHGGFLDRAQSVGLDVMPGYHTYGNCPSFDCYDAWKNATLEGFKYGFKQGRKWHPAISALILLNEPDFFGGYTQCEPAGAWCRVKALLSALDGVLAAEREAGVEAGRVRLTVTWSFGMMPSIDGREGGPGLFGFQDTVAGIADPSIAGYTPRSSQAELAHAFRTRWVHGVNTQAPWSFVKAVISNNYAKFSPIPWFIGEYGANGQPAETIQADLEDMQRTAEEGGDFLGAAFFQFQTAHFKGGAELNFGLFRLGTEKLWEISPPCDEAPSRCPTTWPVHCLSSDLFWLPGTAANRASAVALAWNGCLGTGRGFCRNAGRGLSDMAGVDEGSRLDFQLTSMSGVSVHDLEVRLRDAFVLNLVNSTKTVLGRNAGAIAGDLFLRDSAARATQDGTAIPAGIETSQVDKWSCAAAFLLLGAGGFASMLFLRRKARRPQPNDTASMPEV